MIIHVYVIIMRPKLRVERREKNGYTESQNLERNTYSCRFLAASFSREREREGEAGKKLLYIATANSLLMGEREREGEYL